MWERREVGLAWPIEPRLMGTKECRVENGEKNRNLACEFWFADLEFGDNVVDDMS
jgi:hypothetical protein